MIKCIDNEAQAKRLTVGKEYEVVKKFTSGGSLFYTIIDDRKDRSTFRAYRFEDPERQ